MRGGALTPRLVALIARRDKLVDDVRVVSGVFRDVSFYCPNGTVSAITLLWNNLAGSFAGVVDALVPPPSNHSSLSDTLVQLTLESNTLTGTVPAALTKLQRMEILNFGGSTGKETSVVFMGLWVRGLGLGPRLWR